MEPTQFKKVPTAWNRSNITTFTISHSFFFFSTTLNHFVGKWDDVYKLLNIQSYILPYHFYVSFSISWNLNVKSRIMPTYIQSVLYGKKFCCNMLSHLFPNYNFWLVTFDIITVVIRIVMIIKIKNFACIIWFGNICKWPPKENSHC